MSDTIHPTVVFDIEVGKTFEIADAEPEDLVPYLQDTGLTDEAIKNTLIEFKDGVKPNASPLDECAEAYKRHVIVWLGAFAAMASEQTDDKAQASVFISCGVSSSLAHEARHLLQYETGQLPLRGPDGLEQAKLPYEDRPWEQEAIRAGDDYTAALKRREYGLLVALVLR